MQRSHWLALGAVMATVLAVAPALAAEPTDAAAAPRATATPRAAPAPRAAVARKRVAAKARRGPAAETAKAPEAPEAYQLVPNGRTGSALARARQNSFGTRDDDASSSGVRSRHIGIGLGGSNGMTPGMAIGF